MKRLLSLTFVLTSLAGAFDLPKGSHHIGQLDDVVTEATKAKQPIAFVITKKSTTPT